MPRITNSNSLINLAHQLVKNRLKNGSIALDATIGNGHDTLWLAQLVAPDGIVYGFDIQATALKATHNRLQEAGLLNNIRLILASHANLAEHIAPEHQGRISVIMFNLGYLPGSDKSILTRSDSTLAALNSALELLAPLGLITILAYPGHSGGETETETVQNWCNQLNEQHFQSTLYLSQQAKTSAPRLFVIEKKSL